MANSITQGAQNIDQLSKQQSSQSMLLQTYCNSVISQPAINLSQEPNLQQYNTEINDGLTTAKGHANDYLNNVQPLIITNVASISNYYTMLKAIPTVLPVGSTEAQWIQTLNTIKDQSTQYQSDASSVILKLQGLNSNLGIDSASFSKIVSDLNSAVNGDNGVLASINGELGTIQGKIDGAIAGIALSGLAILGGIFITAVGAIADFVTAGTSTPLVVGGIALIIAGVGGEVASAVTLKSLNDEKSDLLLRKSSLTAEVNLAMGTSNAYTSLNNQAMAAMQAATQMKNAWGFLSSDLGSLISDLENGITSTDQARTLFLTASNGIVQSVLTDTDIIKSQMAGATNSVAPTGQKIGDYIVSVAKQYKAAA